MQAGMPAGVQALHTNDSSGEWRKHTATDHHQRHTHHTSLPSTCSRPAWPMNMPPPLGTCASIAMLCCTAPAPSSLAAAAPFVPLLPSASGCAPWAWLVLALLLRLGVALARWGALLAASVAAAAAANGSPGAGYPAADVSAWRGGEAPLLLLGSRRPKGFLLY